MSVAHATSARWRNHLRLGLLKTLTRLPPWAARAQRDLSRAMIAAGEDQQAIACFEAALHQGLKKPHDVHHQLGLAAVAPPKP